MGLSRRRVIVVGAGVAGLTIALLLSRDGHSVTVVERESEVGGLARSFRSGDFGFDIGPHRFHTDDMEVMRFINSILGDDSITIERKSGVWMFERYFHWPLRFSSLSGMPFPILLSVLLDFVRTERRTGGSFEDYIISTYGRTLYRIFFKPYTEKFLRMPCSEISRDWAVTGIDRAVIDKKMRMDTLYGVARSLVSRKRPLRFVYPRSGGIQVFSEELTKKIRENGGSVVLKSRINTVRCRDHEIQGVTVDGTMFECDLLIWTGPPGAIQEALGTTPSRLEYLSVILYNYRVNHEPLIPYQWCYYGDADIPFNRVSVPKLFNPVLAPPGKTGLCIEVTSPGNDVLWNDPERGEAEIRRALVRVGALRTEEDVLGVCIERIPDTYPVYRLGYNEKREDTLKTLSAYRNLRLLGRTGTFWYNNMDHSIRASFDLYRELSGRMSSG